MIFVIRSCRVVVSVGFVRVTSELNYLLSVEFKPTRPRTVEIFGQSRIAKNFKEMLFLEGMICF